MVAGRIATELVLVEVGHRRTHVHVALAHARILPNQLCWFPAGNELE